MKNIFIVIVLLFGLSACDKKFDTYSSKIDYCINHVDDDLCEKEDYFFMFLRLSIDIDGDACKIDSLSTSKMCIELNGANKEYYKNAMGLQVAESVNRIKKGISTSKDKYIINLLMQLEKKRNEQ